MYFILCLVEESILSLPLCGIVQNFSNWLLSNLMSKVEDGEITEDAEGTRDVQNDGASKGTAGTDGFDLSYRKPINLQHSSSSRKGNNQKALKKVNFMSLFFLYEHGPWVWSFILNSFVVICC